MKLAGFIKVGFCVFSLNSLVIQVSQEPQISKSYRQRIIKYAKLFHKTSQMRRVACKFFVNLFTKENAGTIVENIVLNAANKKKFMLAVTLIERLIFSGRQSQANVLFNHIFDTDNRDACLILAIITRGHKSQHIMLPWIKKLIDNNMLTEKNGSSGIEDFPQYFLKLAEVMEYAYKNKEYGIVLEFSRYLIQLSHEQGLHWFSRLINDGIWPLNGENDSSLQLFEDMLKKNGSTDAQAILGFYENLKTQAQKKSLLIALDQEYGTELDYINKGKFGAITKTIKQAVTAKIPLIISSHLLYYIKILSLSSANQDSDYPAQDPVFAQELLNTLSNSWTIFKNSYDDFFVVLPTISDKQQIPSDWGFADNLKFTTIDNEKQVISSQATATQDINIDHLIALFSRSPYQTRRITLTGHGSSNNAIAQLRIPDFVTLLRFLNNEYLGVELLRIDSCFAGGKNMAKAQSELTKQHNKLSNSLTLSPIESKHLALVHSLGTWQQALTIINPNNDTATYDYVTKTIANLAFAKAKLEHTMNETIVNDTHNSALNNLHYHIVISGFAETPNYVNSNILSQALSLEYYFDQKHKTLSKIINKKREVVKTVSMGTSGYAGSALKKALISMKDYEFINFPIARLAGKDSNFRILEIDPHVISLTYLRVQKALRHISKKIIVPQGTSALFVYVSNMSTLSIELDGETLPHFFSVMTGSALHYLANIKINNFQGTGDFIDIVNELFFNPFYTDSNPFHKDSEERIYDKASKLWLIKTLTQADDTVIAKNIKIYTENNYAAVEYNDPVTNNRMNLVAHSTTLVQLPRDITWKLKLRDNNNLYSKAPAQEWDLLFTNCLPLKEALKAKKTLGESSACHEDESTLYELRNLFEQFNY